jgi:hypothetical protein
MINTFVIVDKAFPLQLHGDTTITIMYTGMCYFLDTCTEYCRIAALWLVIINRSRHAEQSTQLTCAGSVAIAEFFNVATLTGRL